MQKISDRALKLAAFRKKLGLTQEEFGQKFGGFKGQQISYYETDRRKIPSRLFEEIHRQGFHLDDVIVTTMRQADRELFRDLVMGAEKISVDWLEREMVPKLLKLADRAAQRKSGAKARRTMGRDPRSKSARGQKAQKSGKRADPRGDGGA